jgi:hypothetical protein
MSECGGFYSATPEDSIISVRDGISWENNDITISHDVVEATLMDHTPYNYTLFGDPNDSNYYYDMVSMCD